MSLKDVKTIIKEGHKQRKLKRQIKERKKDVDVLQRHLSGGVILEGQQQRLRRVVRERAKRARTNKF